MPVLRLSFLICKVEGNYICPACLLGTKGSSYECCQPSHVQKAFVIQRRCLPVYLLSRTDLSSLLFGPEQRREEPSCGRVAAW